MVQRTRAVRLTLLLRVLRVESASDEERVNVCVSLAWLSSSTLAECRRLSFSFSLSASFQGTLRFNANSIKVTLHALSSRTPGSALSLKRPAASPVMSRWQTLTLHCTISLLLSPLVFAKNRVYLCHLRLTGLADRDREKRGRTVRTMGASSCCVSTCRCVDGP